MSPCWPRLMQKWTQTMQTYKPRFRQNAGKTAFLTRITSHLSLDTRHPSGSRQILSVAFRPRKRGVHRRITMEKMTKQIRVFQKKRTKTHKSVITQTGYSTFAQKTRFPVPPPFFVQI
jgi:hypothetical protein